MSLWDSDNLSGRSLPTMDILQGLSHSSNPTLSSFPPQTHSSPRLHISGCSQLPQSPARPQALSLPPPSFSAQQAPASFLLLLSLCPCSDQLLFFRPLPQPPPWDPNPDSLTPESTFTRKLGAGSWSKKGLGGEGGEGWRGRGSRC